MDIPTTSLLLVEDDPALRTLISGALPLLFRIVTADCRKKALAVLRNSPEISVALIDLGLPPAPHGSEEGVALLRAIRQDGLAVKAIFLSGQDQEETAVEAIREGAFDFLCKPASLDAISGAIDRALLFSRKEKKLTEKGIARLAISAPLGQGLRNVRDEAEERLVRRVLQDTAFNIHEAARRLGIKRENVYYFLKKFGIVRDA